MQFKTKLIAVMVATSVAAAAQAEVKITNPEEMAANPLPNPDAMLEVFSNDQGVLMPRVALESTDSPSPLTSHVAGMELYNTANRGDVFPCMYHNNGQEWVPQCDRGTEWYGVEGFTFAEAEDEIGGEEYDAYEDKDGRIARHGPVGINTSTSGVHGAHNIENFLPTDDFEIRSRNPAIILNDTNGNAYNTGIYWTQSQSPNFSIASDNNATGNNMTFSNYHPLPNGSASTTVGGFKWQVRNPTPTGNFTVVTAWEPVAAEQNPIAADEWFPPIANLSRTINAADRYFGDPRKRNYMETLMTLRQDGTLLLEGDLRAQNVYSNNQLLTSDIRMKKNVSNFEESALSKLAEVETIYYNLKSEADDAQRHIGFSAQNLETVLPELVGTNEETGYKGVAYANMTPVLVKAVQELTAELEALKQADVALRSENATLKLENASIKDELQTVKATNATFSLTEVELIQLKSMLNNAKMTGN